MRPADCDWSTFFRPCYRKCKKFARHAKILQFDVDPAEVNKNIVVNACVMGDVREILKRVNERLEPMEHKEWMEHILEYKKRYPLTYHPQGLSGPYMIEKIYDKIDINSEHKFSGR